MCWLSNLFKSELEKPKPFLPTLRAEVSYTELFQLLRDKFPSAQIFMAREIYDLCNLEDIEEFLRLDDTNRHKYDLRRFRCSDFAFRLQGQLTVPGWSGLAKGIFWSEVHALNCMVDQNLDFWYIEPQTDGTKAYLEPWQGVACRVIIM